MIKGKNLAKSYSNKKRMEITINGWFKTEDLGKLDKDNFSIYRSVAQAMKPKILTILITSKLSLEKLLQNKFLKFPI